jgi:penicillin-binding protein 2
MVTVPSQEDRRTIAWRLGVIQYSVVVVFSLLAVSFWYFQVALHQEFQQMADNNHQRSLTLRAPRGVLFDRHGRVLVENRYAFNISLLREQMHEVTLDQAVALVSAITGGDERRMRAKAERYLSEPRYRPIVLIEDASLGQVAAMRARRFEMPYVVIEEVPTRHYLTEQLAAHLIGYVGEVNEAQLARPEYAGLQPGAIVGQSGLEFAYNRQLMGQDGARHVIVNSSGREVDEIKTMPPAEGERLQLTLDYDLQRAAEEGFKALGFWGSAVFLDPRNGEVLAYVSLPAYDPNAFAAGIDRATWTQLNTDKLKPLQNRAIQGRYSPGSTFKIVVAIAALEEGVVSPSYYVNCPGGGYFYGRWFKCHLAGGHGPVDMRHALEKSCNTYFYTLGNLVGIDRMAKWATALGLGVRSGIELPNEIQGIMPSTEWKKAVTGERWYPGETISVSIGQGQVSVTPISLAVMMATFANGGTRYTPHLVRAVDNGDGWKPLPPPQPQSAVKLKRSTIEAVGDGLWMVVNAAGTGGRARLEGRDVCGKTGTAQVISISGRQAARGTDRDLRDHGFFVFYASRDNPEIAGMAFAEHSEHGYLAAPIAKHVIATYYAKKEGKPLPVFPAPASQQIASSAPPPVPAAATGGRPGGGQRN